MSPREGAVQKEGESGTLSTSTEAASHEIYNDPKKNLIEKLKKLLEKQ